jgi:hypothetical protein
MSTAFCGSGATSSAPGDASAAFLSTKAILACGWGERTTRAAPPGDGQASDNP